MNKGQVRQSRRKIAQHATVLRPVFLAQQPHIVRQLQEPFEHLPGLIRAPHQVQTGHHPEATGQEGSFASLQPFRGLVRIVAPYQSIPRQPFLNRVDCADHARIIGRQKPGEDHAKAGGIQRLRAVALGKCVQLFAEASLHDLLPQHVAVLCPPFHVTFAVKPAVVLHRTSQRHPGHHLAVNKLLTVAAGLPDAVIGQLPDMTKMIDHRALEVVCRRAHVVIHLWRPV